MTINKTISLSQFPNIIQKQSETVATTNSTPIATFSIDDIDTARVLISAVRGTDKQVSEMLVIHDGTDAYGTEYGIVTTNGVLFTADVDINNSEVRILVQGTTSDSTNYTTVLTLL